MSSENKKPIKVVRVTKEDLDTKHIKIDLNKENIVVFDTPKFKISK